MKGIFVFLCDLNYNPGEQWNEVIFAEDLKSAVKQFAAKVNKEVDLYAEKITPLEEVESIDKIISIDPTNGTWMEQFNNSEIDCNTHEHLVELIKKEESNG